MIIRGRVQNGVVVFENDASVPEGTEVTIVVRTDAEPAAKRLTEQQRRALREARQHFEALPNENPSDNFSGADHDQVLYRSP